MYRIWYEINCAISGSMARPISLSDQTETPYVMSVLEEMLRYFCKACLFDMFMPYPC